MPHKYDDLERAAVLDAEGEDDEAVLAVRRRKQQAAKAPEGKARIERLPNLFVRVPLSWFTGSDPRTNPFGPRARLFLLLLHLSRWGSRPVVLTSGTAKEIGLSRAGRWRHLEQLEADGWVRLERNGHKAVVIHPIVITG